MRFGDLVMLGVLDLVRGREVHVHVLRFGFELDVDVVNALITMYVKCGDVQSARLMFDRMPRRGRISWNAMILLYILFLDMFDFALHFVLK